jgi:hypothetical protein
MKLGMVRGFASVVLLTFASGCAHLPEPVASPNGQPLSIHEHTETAQVTVKEKVGEVEYKNSSGQKVGTGEVYENRVHNVQYQVWNAYQGGDKISDDDLYRIAKDEKADREVRESRENGVFLNRLGIGGVILGAVATGAGYALASQSKDGFADTAPRVLVIGGGLTLAAGGLLTWLGFAKARKEHPLEQDRARQAAENYNTTLGATSTTTTTAYGTFR